MARLPVGSTTDGPFRHRKKYNEWIQNAHVQIVIHFWNVMINIDSSTWLIIISFITYPWKAGVFCTPSIFPTLECDWLFFWLCIHCVKLYSCMYDERLHANFDRFREYQFYLHTLRVNCSVLRCLVSIMIAVAWCCYSRKIFL